MKDLSLSEITDSSLLPFLEATDEESSQDHLALLLRKEAEPVIRAILTQLRLKSISHNKNTLDGDDLFNDVIIRLLKRLRRMHDNPEAEKERIGNFKSYVASVVYHAISDYFRQKFPERTKLKNSLRYLLSHNPKYALWTTADHRTVCCFVEYKDTPDPFSNRRYSFDEVERRVMSELSFEKVRSPSYAQVVDTIFRCVCEPIELDDVVDLVAAALNIKDQYEVPFSDIHSPSFAADNQNLFPEPESLEQLRLVLPHICELPQKQLMTILLKCDLVVFTRVTGLTLIQMAELLSVTPEQMAMLRQKAPLKDQEIADLLGNKRQDVINLRTAGLSRLRRRLKHQTKVGKKK